MSNETDDLDRTVDEMNAQLEGTNYKAISANTIPPVLAEILGLYYGAPEEARDVIELALMEVIATAPSRAVMILAEGPYMPREDLGTLEEDFTKAMEVAQEHLPRVALKGTLLDGAIEIAKAVDQTVRRYLITAQNEEYVDRNAFLDILAGHATIMRGIQGLTDVPLDYTGTDSDKSEAARG